MRLEHQMIVSSIKMVSHLSLDGGNCGGSIGGPIQPIMLGNYVRLKSC